MADTVVNEIAVNLTGSEPDCTSSAIRSASALDRLVMIDESLMLVSITWFTVGNATSWPSTTIAVGNPLGQACCAAGVPFCTTMRRVMFVNSAPPPFL